MLVAWLKRYCFNSEPARGAVSVRKLYLKGSSSCRLYEVTPQKSNMVVQVCLAVSQFHMIWMISSGFWHHEQFGMPFAVYTLNAICFQ